MAMATTNLWIGIQAEKIMKTGALVPDSIMLDLIASEFRSIHWSSPLPGSSHNNTSANSTGNNDNNKKYLVPKTASFILDGFPRTTAQASALETLTPPINLVIQLITPPSIIMARITNRWVHEPSGRVYNTGFNPPKVPGRDDVTGEPLTQRADDSVDTWKKRYKRFEETSKPLIGYYEDKGCLWTVKGNSSDEISPKVFREMEKRFC